MNTNSAKLCEELLALFNEGVGILKKEAEHKEKNVKPEGFSVEISYQAWYTVACRVVQQVLPDRYTEFVQLYQMDKRKDIDYLTYTIKDYLLGLTVTRGIYKEEVVNPLSAFLSKFQQQLFILKSAVARLKSRLSDIEGILQSDLFEGELDAALELFKKNHYRASGVLAGVTLEAHLKNVCGNHELLSGKKSPTIADCNDALKEKGIADVPIWRFIQRLADIRNICAHSKDREPRPDEVEDLIVGTKKIIAEIN